MAKLQLFYPIKPFVVIQGFGENPEYYSKNIPGLKAHNGIDCVASNGQMVRAAHDGLVTFAGEDGKGGWGVVIRTLDEREYKDGSAYFKTIFWHLLPTIPVKAGQEVKVGDLIGFADNT